MLLPFSSQNGDLISQLADLSQHCFIFRVQLIRAVQHIRRFYWEASHAVRVGSSQQHVQPLLLVLKQLLSLAMFLLEFEMPPLFDLQGFSGLLQLALHCHCRGSYDHRSRR